MKHTKYNISDMWCELLGIIWWYNSSVCVCVFVLNYQDNYT